MGGQRGGGKGGGRGGGRGGGKGKGGKGPGFTQVIPKFLQQYRHIIEGEKRPDAVGYEALGDSAVDGCVRACASSSRPDEWFSAVAFARAFVSLDRRGPGATACRAHTHTDAAANPTPLEQPGRARLLPPALRALGSKTTRPETRLNLRAPPVCRVRAVAPARA